MVILIHTKHNYIDIHKTWLYWIDTHKTWLYWYTQSLIILKSKTWLYWCIQNMIILIHTKHDYIDTHRKWLYWYNWNYLAVRVVSNIVSLTDLPIFEPFLNSKQHTIHVLALIKCLNSLRHPNKTVDHSIQDLIQSLKNVDPENPRICFYNPLMVRQAHLNVPILAARMLSCHDCGVSIRGSKAFYNHRKQMHQDKKKFN